MLRIISYLDLDRCYTLPATNRNVSTSGYYLKKRDFFIGFHGKKLSGKKSKK